MTQYFEEASEKLIAWIQVDTPRENDFFGMADVLEGETISQYLARNAYRPGIITETIERLTQIGTNRAIKDIQPATVLAVSAKNSG